MVEVVGYFWCGVGGGGGGCAEKGGGTPVPRRLLTERVGRGDVAGGG